MNRRPLIELLREKREDILRKLYFTTAIFRSNTFPPAVRR